MADNTDLGQKLVTLSSQYIQIANNMSTTAYVNFRSGAMQKADFDKTHDYVQQLLQQAADINRQAADAIFDDINVDVKSIDQAIQNLKTAADKIQKVTKIVNISTDALESLASIALAVTSPTPINIMSAVQSANNLAIAIIGLEDAKNPSSPAA